jgi:hypothetical protein
MTGITFLHGFGQGDYFAFARAVVTHSGCHLDQPFAAIIICDDEVDFMPCLPSEIFNFMIFASQYGKYTVFQQPPPVRINKSIFILFIRTILDRIYRITKWVDWVD